MPARIDDTCEDPIAISVNGMLLKNSPATNSCPHRTQPRGRRSRVTLTMMSSVIAPSASCPNADGAG